MLRILATILLLVAPIMAEPETPQDIPQRAQDIGGDMDRLESCWRVLADRGVSEILTPDLALPQLVLP